MSISTSLQSVAAHGDTLWKLRDRRNVIDARVAELRAHADAMASAGDIRGHASAMHRINRLLDERIGLVERIAALSGQVTGMAHATARRLGAHP